MTKTTNRRTILSILRKARFQLWGFANGRRNLRLQVVNGEIEFQFENDGSLSDIIILSMDDPDYPVSRMVHEMEDFSGL